MCCCPQFKNSLAGMMDTITIDYLNNLAKSIWSFASDYGHEQELLDEANASGELWGWMGPTRCTAIIACIPAYTDKSGLSTSARPAAQLALSCCPWCEADAFQGSASLWGAVGLGQA